MPAVLTLVVEGPAFEPGPRQLLGAACRLFETPVSDHHGSVKPFAVGRLVRSAGVATWRAGWLAAGPCPVGWPPVAVCFGRAVCPVVARRREQISFARLAAVGPVRRVRMRVLTPLFFARNGRDLPLPDPVLVARSLLGRWNAHAPAALGVDADVERELLDGVFLAGMAGEMQRVALGPGLWQAGFVGEVELGLVRAAPGRMGQVFGALMRFAGIAGVGAQTTHGFGAVEVAPAGRLGGVLYGRAFGSQALLDPWQQVREAALADGRPDAEVDAFEADAARRLEEMRTALADGSWRPSPVRRVEIAKPAGGMRVLGVPTLADRVVERALLAVLDPLVDPLLPWSFAYRRGLGARDALAALAEARDEGLGWVARADIDDCFEAIPRWEVMRRLREVVDDLRVVHLVGLLLDRPVRGGRTDPRDRGLGLHQGSVLSPLLSNLYLNTFDRAMLAAGWRVIRYSDDFAIPAASRVEAEQALIAASTELESLRLEINAGKSQVVSFEEGVRFLGEVTTASTISRGELLSHPVETVVYVDRQGALVRTRGDRLVVTDGAESLLRLGLRRVRQVVCFGRVGLTTAFLHTAVRRGIEVVLLTEQGTLGGRLVCATDSDPQVRRAQYRAADDERTSRGLAAAFVDGKVTNLRVALLCAARRDDDAEAAAGADLLARLGDTLTEAASLEAVLGVEGTASREYFQALRRMLDADWGFAGRQRRPPPDPVNSMLSYGYTLLVHEGIAAAEAAGLDPMVGFLHRHRWGRPALALDLIEEFRPVTVDAAVWRAIATGQVRPEQFDHDPAQGCRMGADARHTFLAAYERRMLTLTTHQPTGRRVSYRVALSLQAKALARTLLDPGEPYPPLHWK